MQTSFFFLSVWFFLSFSLVPRCFSIVISSFLFFLSKLLATIPGKCYILFLGRLFTFLGYCIDCWHSLLNCLILKLFLSPSALVGCHVKVSLHWKGFVFAETARRCHYLCRFHPHCWPTRFSPGPRSRLMSFLSFDNFT